MAKKSKTKMDIDFGFEMEGDITNKEIKNPLEERNKKEKPYRTKKLHLISITILLIVILFSGIIYFLPTAKDPESNKSSTKKQVAFKKYPQYQFAPFFIPIDTKNGQDVFLKVSFSLELSNEKVIKKIEKIVVPLRADISFLLNKKRLSDLESISGKKKLSLEIRNVINRSLQNGKVNKIYFTQFFLK
jgi:flagellar FliL protein